MTTFAIVEVDNGLTVAPIPEGGSPEDAAIAEGGTLIDPGPYASYDEAMDAIVELQRQEEDDGETAT